MESKTAEDFLWGALIGGAIGAAAALMLTPISGEKLRKKIKDGFPEMELPQKKHQKPHHARKQPRNFQSEEKKNGVQARSKHKPKPSSQKSELERE